MSIQPAYFHYFSEIEETFNSLCAARKLLLSPLDWTLIECWKERNIPLEIVLEGIKFVFEANRKSARPMKIKSLSFFRGEVNTRFAAWKKKDESKIRNAF